MGGGGDLVRAPGQLIGRAGDLAYLTAFADQAAVSGGALLLSGEARGLSAAYRRALAIALGVRAGSSPDQLMLCNAALALLVQTAAAGPVLVVVQDLPWLDRASAVVLGVVARRLAGTRVGYRSEGHRVPRRAASRRPGGGPIFLNATPASGPARRRAVARGAALETEVGLRAGQLAA